MLTIQVCNRLRADSLLNTIVYSVVMNGLYYSHVLLSSTFGKCIKYKAKTEKCSFV